jgi:hypothetical protein
VRRGFASLALAIAWLVSCSTLPEQAAPKGSIFAPGSVDLSDAISYRALTRADFRSSAPPAQFGPVADSIGAATCGYIVAAPGARFANRLIPASGGAVLYEATPDGIRYSAHMDRSCSWWNPKDLGIPPDYVLEHEQIHFAIFELEARRLNGTIEQQLRATAATPEEASSLVQEQLEAEVRSCLATVLERSRDFDEDTSMGHKPEAQKRWLARVQAELEELGP